MTLTQVFRSYATLWGIEKSWKDGNEIFPNAHFELL